MVRLERLMVTAICGLNYFNRMSKAIYFVKSLDELENFIRLMVRVIET